MAAINDLIKQISDVELRDRIEKEVAKLSKQKKFGLVFEEHLPECTPLYDIQVKKGSTVTLKAGKVSDTFKVVSIDGDIATCINANNEAINFNLDDLVCVAEFGEPIYPYLKPIDSVCNAPDSDLWHTLIESDNYHALQLLEYLYAGKVDCIYIDPPYNTGAKDWKYNNDYVDSGDAYRHSKWLSFMERRLKIAKKLLNPDDSALIVTIDEKEYLHLGCLLEEMFPEAKMQMISSEIHHGGTNRKDEFSRINEFVFFLRFGNCAIYREKVEGSVPIPWRSFLRSSWKKAQRPNLFYPIYVNVETGKIIKIGEPAPSTEQKKEEFPKIDGCVAVFPINKDGSDGIWRLSSNKARKLLDAGYFKVISKKNKYSFSYLLEGVIKDIECGRVLIEGKDEQGCVIGRYSDGREITPATQWSKASHDASQYGSVLLKSFLGDRFSFPKSLYAVHDCVNYFVREKKDALLIDFFAGSGTTLHAVNLLNAEDGGQRRCILVTNNEVSEEEAKSLKRKGYKPGDKEWESLGIAHYVTWPRTVCSIEGHDISGNPLKGKYIGSDFPMADGFKTNAAFFKLGFLDKTAVALGLQFKELLPVLWMKAGAVGPCPSIEEDYLPEMLILSKNKFAVLIDENFFDDFAKELEKNPDIETAYIITDYDVNYKNMVSNLNVKTTYQLYRDYLDNFRINHGRY